MSQGRRTIIRSEAQTVEAPAAREDFAIVHARLLRFFPDLVHVLGGDPDRLMEQAGIVAEDRAEGGPGGNYRQMVHLLELAATRLHCPDFGMRLAKLQRARRLFGPLGLVMKNSHTFGDALDYVGTHTYAHSLAARIWLKPSRHGNWVFVGHDILLDRIPRKSQAMEQILLVGHLAAMDLTGGHARARKVLFRHQPISTPATYRAYFGCEVRFGQDADGVVFSASDLACPIVDPDARAYETATSFIDARFTGQHPPFHAQTRGLIMQSLGTEQCTNEWIAAELHLHPRTLHRRLTSEGTSFQQIKDEVRRDAMLYYLQHTEFDLARVSEKLGFSEQSVLSRSCNRWFAACPTQMRALGRGPG